MSEHLEEWLGKWSLHLCLTFERPFFSQVGTGAKIFRLENCRHETPRQQNLSSEEEQTLLLGSIQLF